jgi:hypothetical protein
MWQKVEKCFQWGPHLENVVRGVHLRKLFGKHFENCFLSSNKQILNMQDQFIFSTVETDFLNEKG